MSIEVLKLHQADVTLCDINKPWDPLDVSAFFQHVPESRFDERKNWEGMLERLESSRQYCHAADQLRRGNPYTIAVGDSLVVLVRITPPTNLVYTQERFQSLVQILPTVQLVARAWENITPVILEIVQTIIPPETHYILQERQWPQPSQPIFGKLVIPGDIDL